ncbi:MAG: TIM barrel protein [Candidatus Nanoarchaeia archaeon]
MEKSGSEKTYPSRRRACYQSVTGSGRFLIDNFDFHISIENMPKDRWVSINELEKIHNKYKNAGFCLDTAHAFSYSKVHLKEIIDHLGGKITQVHLSGRRNGRDHVALTEADTGFYESIIPLKEINVPVIIEEDMEFNIKKARKEVAEVKKLLQNS